MTEDYSTKSVSLAVIIPMSPPAVQKLLIEKILEMNDIKFTNDVLNQYEEYWKIVQKNYSRNFLQK